MEEKILQEAGLTKGESRVYMALLKLGESTVGPISKEASVSLSKIYEILENLIKKGLASSITKNNVRHFSASQPERILDYLENRKAEISRAEEKIRKLIPAMKSIVKKHERKAATLYEGLRGIKTFYETILSEAEKGDCIYVMGVPLYAAKRYEGYFLNWNRRRAKKGVGLKIIFDSNVAGLGRKREKIKYTEVRYLPKNFRTPSWIFIYKNIVATIHLAEKPICVVIEDKNVSQSYKNFFSLLWRSSY